MNHFLLVSGFVFFLFLNVHSQEASTISDWKSNTRYGNVKEGRVFECSGTIKLGSSWGKDEPEILIKTLDKDGLIMQVSEPTKLDEKGSFKATVPGMKDFVSYKLFLRHKNNTEVFTQTFKKRTEMPVDEITLISGEVKIDFKQKADAVSSKSGDDCVITGQLVNKGARQATDVKVVATLQDALGKDIKKVEFIIKDNAGNPIVFDGSDVYAFKEHVKGVKGYARAKFSITWSGDDEAKEIVVDNGLVGLSEQTFEFDKVVGDASITKITTSFEGKDLTLKIELLNDLGKVIVDPVVEVKLINSKGEVIQTLLSPLEGELSHGLRFEFSTVHKNTPQFSGIQQSIRYSTKK